MDPSYNKQPTDLSKSALPPAYSEFGQPSSPSPIAYMSPNAAQSSPVYVPSQQMQVSLKTSPALVVCPRCTIAVRTTTKSRVGAQTWCCCLLLAPLCCQCCWPFCWSCTKDVEHSCPSCGYVIHRYLRTL